MKSFKILAIFVIISLSLGSLEKMAFGAADSYKEDYREKGYEYLRMISHALTLINSQYIDEEKASCSRLSCEVSKGVIAGLGDPYSQIMDPQRYQEVKGGNNDRGKGGIGVVVGIRKDKIVVISPFEDSPAYLSGIKSGDQIIEIDGQSVKGLTLSDVVYKLRGQIGNQISLSVQRENSDKLLKFDLSYDRIELESIKYKLLSEKIGYVRVITFNQETQKKLELAINDLQEKGIKGLVLDLRNNPGGEFDSAIAFADSFLPTEGLIVSVKGQKDSKEYRSTSSKKFWRNQPLIVLINEGSASASEIVAGAIQGNNCGLIIGTRSFGKGSVQTILPFVNGYGLLLTSHRYYTPAGILIEKNGITPDVIVEDEEAQLEEAIKRLGKPESAVHVSGY